MADEITFSLFIGTLVVVRIAVMVVTRALEEENEPVSDGTTRYRMVAVPLLLEWLTDDPSVEFEKIVTLIRGGDLRLGNRFFKRHDKIDFKMPGGAHAYRKAGADRLYIKTGTGQTGNHASRDRRGADRQPRPSETYIFEYKGFLFGMRYAWCQLLRRFV